MIYNQNFFYYILTFVIAVIAFFRTSEYLKSYLDKYPAYVASLVILLHPLSLDIFYGPNFISGILAFYFFIEALHALKHEALYWAIGLNIVAAACNLAFCLFPIYFYYINRKKLNFGFGIILYSLLLIVYYWKHLLLIFHNPLNFFSYFTINLILPTTLSNFHFGLFPFSDIRLVSAIFIFIIFYWRHTLHPIAKDFWPYFLFPFAGIFAHQWTGIYSFWDELMLYPSTYLCFTFGFITLLAIYIPRTYFYLYSTLIISYSLFILMHSFPLSNSIGQSVVDLPEGFKYSVEAKRVLAWQYLFENKDQRGYDILKILQNENPTNKDIATDIENFKIK